ncbi:MAG: DUF3021 family protein [Clostridiales bacterium]|nr:DUF3021 family protein [Clostridiales bacterium]
MVWKYFRDNILYPGCLIFTVCVFVFAVLASMAQAMNLVPGLIYMFLLFVFSLLFAALNLLFRSRFSKAAQILLHFAGLTTAFVIVFILAGGYYQNGGQAVAVIMLFYVLVYLLSVSVYMGVNSIRRRKSNEKSEYKKQF